MLHCQEHYEEDGGEKHTAQEFEQVMTEAGRLLWRLEQEIILPRVNIVPSEWAVPPEFGAELGGRSNHRDVKRPALPAVLM